MNVPHSSPRSTRCAEPAAAGPAQWGRGRRAVVRVHGLYAGGEPDRRPDDGDHAGEHRTPVEGEVLVVPCRRRSPRGADPPPRGRHGATPARVAPVHGTEVLGARPHRTAGSVRRDRCRRDGRRPPRCRGRRIRTERRGPPAARAVVRRPGRRGPGTPPGRRGDGPAVVGVSGPAGSRAGSGRRSRSARTGASGRRSQEQPPAGGAMTVHPLDGPTTALPATGSTTGLPATGSPVAVVGVGCRFPGGADSPAAYWRLLTEGRDAVGTVPEGRWERLVPLQRNERTRRTPGTPPTPDRHPCPCGQRHRARPRRPCPRARRHHTCTRPLPARNRQRRPDRRRPCGGSRQSRSPAWRHRARGRHPDTWVRGRRAWTRRPRARGRRPRW